MIHMQSTKLAIVSSPAAILDNASAVTNVIDTKGYDYCTIICTVGATDIAMSALSVQEAEVAASATALTSGANVTGLIFGTSTNTGGSASTLPTAGSDDLLFVFEIDCRNRMRYLDITATFGNGTAGGYFAAIAILSRAEQGPVTAAERGASQILRV